MTVGGTTTLLLSIILTKNIEITTTLNGILAGLVSITAPCAVVEPVGAFVIGVIGGALQYFSSSLLLKLRIDDPLEATPVHLGKPRSWEALETPGLRIRY